MKLKIVKEIDKARFHFTDSVIVSDGKTINITVSVKSEDKDSRDYATKIAGLIVHKLNTEK